MLRDLSDREFRIACRRAGFVQCGGYHLFRLPVEDDVVTDVSTLRRRRDRLAFLHRATQYQRRRLAKQMLQKQRDASA